MDYIQTSNKAVDLYGAGKHGFAAGVPGTGTLATFLSAAWCNGVQEEILNTIEGAGIAASGATLTQMRQAIKRLAGGNLRTISAVGPTALTADDAGLILVDATANNVTITLPAANAVAGVPLEFEFVRLDATANAVTINRAGADTFLGGATSFALLGQKDQRTVRSDAVSKWMGTVPGGNQSLGTVGYRDIGGGMILQWGSVTTSTGADVTVTFPLTFPLACWSITTGIVVTGGNVGACIASANTSQFTLSAYNGSTRQAQTVWWMAAGK